MKAWLQHLLVVLCLFGLVVGCGDTPENGGEDMPEKDEMVSGRTVSLLTGSEGGTYYALGEALAEAGKGSGLDIDVRTSPGSVENLYLSALGHVDFAMVQANILTHPRYATTGQWVEVVAPLFKEEVHLVVRPNAGIKTIADLKGKKVGLGGRASGTAPTARAILTEAGIDFRTDIEADRSGPARALKRVKSGWLDAAFLVGGAPLGNLEEGDSLELLSLETDLIESLARRATFQESIIAGGTYSWQKADVATVAVPALLVSRAGASDEDVQAMKDLLSGGGLSGHPKFDEIGSLNLSMLQRTPRPAPERKPEKPYILLGAGKGGTYDQIARGIAAAGKNLGVTFDILNTQGSFRNLLLLANGQADMAIVQGDLLAEASASDQMRPLLAKIRLVLPLYKEEFHVVTKAGSGLASFQDLGGKKVYTGMAASGTYFTTHRLLEAADLKVRPVRGTSAEALDALQAGKIHAMMYVGGQPVELLGKAKGVTLLPVPRMAGYDEAFLNADSYDWLDTEIETVSTEAFLVSREEVSADAIQGLVRGLFAQQTSLEKWHAKWAELSEDRTREVVKMGAPLGAHQGTEAALAEMK